MIAQQSFGYAFSSIIYAVGFAERRPWALLFQLLEKAEEWKRAKKGLLYVLIICSSTAPGSHDLNRGVLTGEQRSSAEDKMPNELQAGLL